MSDFDSILVPLDGSPEAAKALACARWLAGQLGARLHQVGPAPEPQSFVARAIVEHDAKLLVMTARGQSANAGVDPDRPLGGVARALIEQGRVPVLLLPLRYREALPWTSMLAAALRLTLIALHCVDGGASAGVLGVYADAAHHEYPRRLEELVRPALASRPVEECRWMRAVFVCRGDPAAELLAEVKRRRASVLALGTHGALGPGRAAVLKRLLEQAECPLLIVQAAARSAARLKVAEDIYT